MCIFLLLQIWCCKSQKSSPALAESWGFYIISKSVWARYFNIISNNQGNITISRSRTNLDFKIWGFMMILSLQKYFSCFCKITSTKSIYPPLSNNVLWKRFNTKCHITCLFTSLSLKYHNKEATAHSWPKILEIEMMPSQKLQLEDSGRYKCRVDYFLEQTTFHLIDLKVVVPPQKPKIFLENGLRVNNRLSARLNSSISLKCESIGGFPSPDLTWWLNNRELPSVMFER